MNFLFNEIKREMYQFFAKAPTVQGFKILERITSESGAIFTRVEKIIGEFHLGDNEGSLGGGRERAPGGGS